jgi:MHS family metabolite:H+ symporter-like MFS transporter
VFFPESDPAVGFLLSMATYGTGYVARLVGAIFFGRIGDKIGRRAVMFYTICLMGLSTAVIGLLPSYGKIGIWAPILLVVLRLVQGFGAGAEIAGAGVMVTEFADPKRRGFIASLVGLGTNCGTLFSSGIWAILLATIGNDNVISYGWRIPFLFSFFVMIIAVLIRLFVKESPVIVAQKEALKKEKGEKKVVLKGKKLKFGKAFWIACGLRLAQGNSGLLKTFTAGFLTTYVLAVHEQDATKYGATFDPTSKTFITNVIMLAAIVAFVTIPVSGVLGDKFGRRKMYIVLNTIVVILTIPACIMINSGNRVLIAIAYVVILNIGVEMVFAQENVTMTEIFGSENRMTLTALAKEVAGLINAIVPVGASALVITFYNINPSLKWVPLAIIMALSAIFAIIASSKMPEVRGRDLNIKDDAI